MFVLFLYFLGYNVDFEMLVLAGDESFVVSLIELLYFLGILLFTCLAAALISLA